MQSQGFIVHFDKNLYSQKLNNKINNKKRKHDNKYCMYVPVYTPPPSLANESIAAVRTIVFGSTLSYFILSNNDITICGLKEVDCSVFQILIINE